MTLPGLLRLVPDAHASLVDSSTRGAAAGAHQPVQRSSGRSVSRSTDAASARRTPRTSPHPAPPLFFPRLRDNIRVLREAHRYIGEQAKSGYEVSTAAEWLLDNFHLVEAQLREIREGLPRRYFRDLPVLIDEPLVGLPRIYGVAWAFVAHTDSAFSEELLVLFLNAYQETRELTLGELWALPTTLRVVLIENLRRLAERAAANKAARGIANLCCDRLEGCSPERLDQILALMNARGVGEPFLAQMAQQLQDHRSPANARFFDWLERVAPHLADIQTRLPAEQAADNLSVGNAITSLRALGDAHWPDIVAQTSGLTRLMLGSPAFAAERDDTRDQTLHAIGGSRASPARASRVATALLGRSGCGRRGENEDDDDAHNRRRQLAAGAVRAELCALSSARRRPRSGGSVGSPAPPCPPTSVVHAGHAAVGPWMLFRHSVALPEGSTTPWLTALAALLHVPAASDAVVAIINGSSANRCVPSGCRARPGARRSSRARTMVVIPAMLPTRTRAANSRTGCSCTTSPMPRRNVQFALLTELADGTASTDRRPCRARRRRAEIVRLNTQYRFDAGEPARFSSCTGSGSYSSPSGSGSAVSASAASSSSSSVSRRQCRKRVHRSRPALPSPPTRATCSRSTATPACRPECCASSSASPAHPHNRPRLSADGKRFERGYGILQPHVATPLPAPEDLTSTTAVRWPAGSRSVQQHQLRGSTRTCSAKARTRARPLDVHALHAVIRQRLPRTRC